MKDHFWQATVNFYKLFVINFLMHTINIYVYIFLLLFCKLIEGVCLLSFQAELGQSIQRGYTIPNPNMTFGRPSDHDDTSVAQGQLEVCS